MRGKEKVQKSLTEKSNYSFSIHYFHVIFNKLNIEDKGILTEDNVEFKRG